MWCVSTPLTLGQTSAGKTAVEDRIAQAQALQSKSRADQARKIYESSLPTLRKNGPLPQLGHVLSALSHIADADGEYELAVRYGQESADAYRRAGDAKGEAHALLNRGIAEMDLGSYKAAHESLATALTLSRQAKDPENEVQVLNNQGNTDYFQGHYFEALRSYEQARATLKELSDAPWIAYWRQVTDFNEATLYQRLGRYEKALEVYRRVQASSSQLTASNRAHLLGNLGALYRRLGDARKALDAYRSAQKLYSEEHDVDGEIGVLKNIGIVYALDLGELSRAEQIFRDTLSLAERTHNRLEEMQAHLYLAETFLRERSEPIARSEFERTLTLAHELGTTEEQWKAHYGRGRVEGLAGNLPAAESDYRQAVSIIDGSRSGLHLSALRAEFLADKRDAFDSLISILFAKREVKEAFSFLERSRARTFQDRLTTSTNAAPAGPLGMDETCSRLTPATMLLEFWAPADQVGLIWCTRDSFGMVVKTISTGDREAIQKVLRGVPDVFGGNWRDRLAALDVIPANLPAFSNDIRHLLIVPDAWLSFLPFDLLPIAPGSQTLLIERFDISYLPSATLIRRPNAGGPGLRFPWERELVAFGDPRVAADQGSPGEGGIGAERTILPLPSSADEIHSIAALTHGVSELFLGPSDLKRVFVGGKANSAPLLHVSTHGFADADNPEQSRMLFSPEHPDAGADYIFLRELYDLDLTSVQLATISACDTERGAIIRGEGAQAFSRALLAAGARSAVTTLWRVEDDPTAQFMKLFYFFALVKREPEAEALRLAKLKFLNSKTPLDNPRYWAAFVLNGDGLTPLPTVFSWPQVIVSSVFILLVLGCGMMWALRLRRGNDRKHFP